MHTLKKVLLGHGRKLVPSPINARTFATPLEKTQPTIELEYDHMTLSSNPGTKFHYAWLRDHCRCEHCLHPITKQKLSNTGSYAADTKAIHAETEGQRLTVYWDDTHRSEFQVPNLLRSFNGETLARKTVEQHLWNRDVYENLNPEKIQHEELMNDVSAVKKLTYSLLKYGVAVVTGAANTEETALSTVARLAPPMYTHEGNLTILGKEIDMNDISYGACALPMHTDMPYLTLPPAILFLQAFVRKCTGGATIVVDAFKIAEDLRQYDEGLFNALCLGQRYFSHQPNGMRYANYFPLISCDGDVIKSVRYGNLYSGLLVAPMEMMPEYYEALRLYESMIHDEKYQVHVYLQEGDQCFMDNNRLIHGRAAYKGERIMAGVNISLDDFRSKAREFGFVE